MWRGAFWFDENGKVKMENQKSAAGVLKALENE
jgi:hypothetical protein